jgi:hypothetical protein
MNLPAEVGWLFRRTTRSETACTTDASSVSFFCRVVPIRRGMALHSFPADFRDHVGPDLCEGSGYRSSCRRNQQSATHGGKGVSSVRWA